MRSLIHCVKAFHEKFGIPVRDDPAIDEEQQRFRMRALEEEYHEYRYAERGGDLIKVADALADMMYVIVGTALVYGIPIEQVFREVHRSNMTKLWPDGTPHLREDGKVLKGPNYRKPDIAAILLEAKYGADDI